MVRLRTVGFGHLCFGAESTRQGQDMTSIGKLANGLTVITRPMAGLETASVALFAAVGSRHEEERLNGLAHLFEHMVFKGAGGRTARQISEAIEDVGGDLNAATDRDGTNFMASVMAEHIPLGLELIADIDRKSTRLNSSHANISYAVFCLEK